VSSSCTDAGRVPSVPASGAIQRLELAQAACEQLEHGRRQKHGLELQRQGDAALRAALAHGSSPPPSWKPAAAQPTAAAAGPAPPATPEKQTVNDVASPVAPAEALEQGPVMRGLTVDVPRLAALLRRQAAASGASMAQLWQQAQAAVLRQSLRVLLACLERTEVAPTAEARLTAGVSYVVHSESTQQGARGMAQLPHLGGWSACRKRNARLVPAGTRTLAGHDARQAPPAPACSVPTPRAQGGGQPPGGRPC
jgi:hypothetical protein